MTGWLKSVPWPVRKRGGAHLRIEPAYMELRGRLVEALLLAWLELEMRFRIAAVAEREGIEAAEALWTRARAGAIDERLWAPASPGEIRSRGLHGAAGETAVRQGLRSLCEDGLIEIEPPQTGSHNPNRYQLRVDRVEAALAQLSWLAESALAGDPGSLAPTPPPDPAGGVSDPQGGGADPKAPPAHPPGAPVEGAAPHPADPSGAPVASVAPIGRGRTSRVDQEEREATRSLARALAGGLPRIGTSERGARRASKAGVPGELYGIDLERLPAVDESYEAARRLLALWTDGELPGVLLSGGASRGKSTLAAAAVSALFEGERPLRVHWIHCPSLPGMLQGDWQGPMREINAHLTHEGAGLVLDDLGPLEGRRALERLDAAVAQRVSGGQPLLVTTELSVDELVGAVGERLTTRLVGYCELAELSGPNLVLGGRAA